MSEPTRSDDCLRCGGTMESGFVYQPSRYSRLEAEWVEGIPERGVLGLKGLMKRRRFQVEAERCTECGWLDMYARIRRY